MLIGTYTQNINNKTRLYYVHIPKTGGTSINSFFRRIFGAVNSIIHVESLLLPLQARRANAERCCNYNFVSGHLPFDFFAVHFRPHGFKAIVSLRNPIEHFVSQVLHICNARVLSANGNTDQFDSSFTSNPNKFFADTNRDELEFFTNPQTKTMFGSNLSNVQPQIDERARWVLQNYDTAVLSEDLNKLSDLITVNGDCLEFGITHENKGLNDNKHDIIITDKILALLKEDIDLYDEIKRINTVTTQYLRQLVR